MHSASLSPSPRIKNYREHSGVALSADELQRVFGGNPTFLRRLADIALAAQPITHPAHHPTTAAAGVRNGVTHG